MSLGNVELSMQDDPRASSMSGVRRYSYNQVSLASLLSIVIPITL